MKNRLKGVLAILLILIVIAISYGVLIIGRNNLLGISAEETFELFNVLVTIAATSLVVLQLYESRKVKCCDMMSQMNMGFLENDRMMKLYHELENSYRDENYHFEIYNEEDDMNDPNHVHQPDLVAYLTFYECLYSYLQSGVISISELDNYFGDRFFKLVHNPYIQERELYAVPSSYANIFDLYKLWYGYRVKNKTALIAGNAHPIPQIYFKNNLYMEEVMFQELEATAREFSNKNGKIVLTYKRLFPSKINAVLDLQKEVVKELEAVHQKEYLVVSTKEEILESMLIDYCFGLFDGDKLVAFCITVLNRNTDRNLASLIKKGKEYKDYVTVDSVQVSPEYRGFKIQRFFLEESEAVTKKCSAKHMIATVSLENEYSERNFTESGFVKYGGSITIHGGMYQGATRNVFVKNLSE